MKSQFLLDVRTPEEFQNFHLENSINIPINKISNNLEKLSKIKEEILIICRSGSRANYVKEFLNQEGIKNTKVLEGGLLRYNTK